MSRKEQSLHCDLYTWILHSLRQKCLVWYCSTWVLLANFTLSYRRMWFTPMMWLWRWMDVDYAEKKAANQVWWRWKTRFTVESTLLTRAPHMAARISEWIYEGAKHGNSLGSNQRFRRTWIIHIIMLKSSKPIASNWNLSLSPRERQNVR